MRHRDWQEKGEGALCRAWTTLSRLLRLAVGPITVRTLLDEYLAVLEDSRPLDMGRLRSQLKPVYRLLGAREVETLRARELEDYRATRRDEKTQRGGPPAHGTINRELTYLRAALNRAYRLEAIGRVPHVAMRRENSRRYEWCSKERLERILGYLTPRHPLVADLVEAYFLTGWRRREVLGLRWEEVDFDRRLIVLPPERNRKSREPRIFPMVGRLLEIARSRASVRQGPLVFHREGKPVVDFRKAWRSACSYAGCPEQQIHGFRASFATTQLKAGVPVAITMALAGWRTDSIYRRYLIRDEEMLRDGVTRMVAYLESPQPPRAPPGDGRGRSRSAPA